jgi:hypothetical protein
MHLTGIKMAMDLSLDGRALVRREPLFPSVEFRLKRNGGHEASAVVKVE